MTASSTLPVVRMSDSCWYAVMSVDVKYVSMLATALSIAAIYCAR